MFFLCIICNSMKNSRLNVFGENSNHLNILLLAKRPNRFQLFLAKNNKIQSKNTNLIVRLLKKGAKV